MSQPQANAIPMSRPKMTTRTITTLSMLTGIAFVVMLMSKVIPSFNGFLDFDFKDVIICIGGFTFGPLAKGGFTFGPLAAAALATCVAFLEFFTVSHTGVIGLVMNILATCSFCCTASFVYKKFHTKLGAILGLTLGVVALTAVMLLWNYLITPLYMEGFSRGDVAAMLVPIFLPFNLLKGGMNMAATMLLYKPVVTALRKANLVPAQGQSIGKTSTSVLVLSGAVGATIIVGALVYFNVL